MAHAAWSHLETVPIDEDLELKPFRLPVQWVNRPNLDFRGFSGTISSGSISVGDAIVEPASGQTSTVKEIVTFSGNLDTAYAGQAITLTLNDEIDVSRGDMLSATQHRPTTADQFEAKLVWMDEEELLPGRNYLIQLAPIPRRLTLAL